VICSATTLRDLGIVNDQRWPFGNSLEYSEKLQSCDTHNFTELHAPFDFSPPHSADRQTDTVGVTALRNLA
jgi:hypothetical protein